LTLSTDACLLPRPQGGSNELKLRCTLALALGTILTTATAATVLAQGTSGNRYVVSGTGGNGLVVRGAASADSSVLGSLQDGTQVVATDGPVGDGQNTWLRIEDRAGTGVAGWSSASYLHAVGSSGQSVSATDASNVSSSPASRTISGVVTGYATGDDGGRVGAMTASGTRTHWGTIAADLRLYPFGTKVTIEGFDGTVFVVEDSGGGVRGDVFDVWFPDVATAAAFGTQRRKVTILGSN
jgi:3D (Asp-Asp-Asp) domain-containing protein